MAPTNLEKAEKDRELQATMLGRLETQMNRQVNQPMSEIEADHILAQSTTLRGEVIETHRKILACSPDPAGPHAAQFINFLDKLDFLDCTLKGIKASLRPPTVITAATASSTSTQDIRLPKLELPIFSGDLADWMTFRDMFQSTVHINSKLSDAQKLTYLRSVLSGDAAKLIKSIPSTDANYTIAWDLLLERFQNERELFFSILKRFVSQPSVQGDSSSSLRSLVDVTKECLRSLKTLKIPVDQWSGIIIFLMVQKLDASSRQFWELSLKTTAIPVLSEFLEFLEQRARALVAGGMCKPAQRTNQTTKSGHESSSQRVTQAFHTEVKPSNCKMCFADHHHFKCPKFLAFTIRERQAAVRTHSLCFNCLRDGHGAVNCPNLKTCRFCKGKHHSLLHADREPGPTEKPQATQPTIIHHVNDDKCVTQTLLATALVKIQDRFGKFQLCRALLDGGSTTSLVTESCIQRLGLSRSRSSAEVVGLAATSMGSAKGIVSITFYPHGPSQDSFSTAALILPKITGCLPSYPTDPTVWPHLQGLELADPHFFTPGEIDLLIGGDVFWNLLLDGKKTGPPNTPIGLRTTLGWLVAGTLDSVSSKIRVHHADVDLDARLRSFWELESIPSTRSFTREEQNCEEHFQSTHKRQADGRFVVELPFKLPHSGLGPSRDIAIRRLKHLERRLSNLPERREEYVKFMDEYESLGHMEIIPEAEVSSSLRTVCYVPHHFVLKESSTSTKFRTVFDASSKTSSGISLNETLMVGPTIQESLISILMRFRTHSIAFTADIAKMYRQILIHPPDREFQRIVWRRNANEQIRDYRLCTVTYGTSSAPFHAVRVLQQLAEDEKDDLPLAYEIAKSDFYVDDLMSGARNEEEALKIQVQLLELTRRGGFDLRKWSSNSSSVLAAIPPELRETQIPLQINTDEMVKTLGLFWNPGLDSFTFKVTLDPINPVTTMRELLSDMAKVFDPLGWLSPIIIRAKIIFQQLWKLKVGWDDPLPIQVKQEWDEFRRNLPSIEKLKIRRCVVPADSIDSSLHGFCDASEKAYAAAVYLRAESPSTGIAVSMIAAKSRVAPAKQVSLPRLELCGATLLTQLMTTVKTSLKIKIDHTHAWTDSTTVLAWVRAHPSRWKTFIANRVTEIQDELPEEHWNHVSGIENPADCASRGIDPTELKDHPLWWTGPAWLQSGTKPTNTAPPEEPDLIAAEQRSTVFIAHAVTKDENSLLHRVSTLRKLKALTALCWRFVHNCKTASKSRQQIIIQSEYRHGPLRAEELERAFMFWIRKIQRQEFSVEIKQLEASQQIDPKSRLLSLNPFLDSTAMLRVGGRLRHSSLPLDQKYPILLPRHHRLTELIIIHEHLSNFHAGPQLVLSNLQQRFWILGARDAIGQKLKKCVKCTRYRPPPTEQLMGDLPAARVNPGRAFLKCGVDYGGPFLLRPIPPRSKITYKAYLALFVCFTTRAVHLEVVSALSTEAFLAALKRFIARRGLCSDIYSDCGTNFVGASRELKELHTLVNSMDHNAKVANYLVNDGITWHFNSPGAPHFGGLWEAGIKSVKYHLHRILGSTRLTFEEMTTMMAQIESCLNSRPLTPISSDPSDMTALTPGHFLIGAPLRAIPEPDLTSLPTNRLSRWQLIQQLHQHFWTRWSREFLSRLQQRPKWMNQRTNIKVDDMVLIKDDNLPPLQWRLGRVTQTHPGLDGAVRIVTVKTADGIIKRPIVKLCLLPLDSNINSETDQI